MAIARMPTEAESVAGLIGRALREAGIEYGVHDRDRAGHSDRRRPRNR